MYDPYNPYESDNHSKIEVNFKRNRISTKKSGIGTVNAGGAIIIIIFVVLCLTIFGLLSFTTSFADKKLADKNLQSVSQFYAADALAEKKLAVIFNSVYDKIQSEANFVFDENFVNAAILNNGLDEETIKIMNADYEEASADENMNSVEVAYYTSMENTSNADVRFFLSSVVNLFYNQNTGKLSYKITEWKVYMDSDLVYDEGFYELWMSGGNGGDIEIED